MELGFIVKVVDPMILYCDNSEAVDQAKEPRNHRKCKHIERKYHLFREIVQRGDIGSFLLFPSSSLLFFFFSPSSLSLYGF